MTESDSAVEQYRNLHALYGAFHIRIDDLFRTLISSAGIDIIQIESRTKAISSLEDKIHRKAKSRPLQLAEVTDLIGIRAITYYPDDVETIGDLIRSEFAVDLHNSEDKSTLLEPDRFGYTSVHYVVRLSEKRELLPEWAAFKGIPVEIQVRTALQHAWAAVSHKLDYKRAADAPRDVRRRLFRLSALFEIADEQLLDIRTARERIDESYASELEAGDLALPIDTASIDAFVDQSPSFRRFTALVHAANFAVKTREEVGDSRWERDRSDLIRTLQATGFQRLADVDAFLRDEERLKVVMRPIQSSGNLRTGTIEDLLTTILMVAIGVDQSFARSVYAEATQLEIDSARERLETFDGTAD